MTVAARQDTATLATTLRDAVARGHGIALRGPDAADPDAVTYPGLETAAGEIGRGLMALGVEPGDRVAILAGTRHEWTLADIGALWAGAVVVPIYQTNSPEECEYVLADSGARVVIGEDAAQLAKLRDAGARCPALEHRVVMLGEAPGAIGLDGLRARGRTLAPEKLARRTDAVSAGDVATIVYTSGTTGPPKGCLLTHGNLLSSIEMVRGRLALDGSMRVYMFLPLAHVLARVTQFVTLAVGGTLIFWRGDPRAILDELAEARPTHLPAVPRIFEKIHARILGDVADQGAVRRRVFAWALAEGARARTGRARGPLPGPGSRSPTAWCSRGSAGPSGAA